MKKIIAFLAVILTGMAAFLIYLVAQPYIEMKGQATTNTVGYIQGNIIGGEVQSIPQEPIEPAIKNEVSKEPATQEINPGTAEIAAAVANMTKEDIDLYNISFTGYEGKNMNGQIVRALIDNVVTSNNANVGKPALFVAVTQDYDSTSKSTIGVPANLNNTQDIIYECNEELGTLKYNTDREANYNIECIYQSGVVTEVKITKVK